MKIKKFQIENFRNFKNKCTVECSTDGKVTIIYGKNGDGKTTIHQFFQWMFYEKVHFNQTTSNKMYNLELESKQRYGEEFHVKGNIEFSHDHSEYSLTREWTYRKGLQGSDLTNRELSLLKKDNDNNWKRVQSPKEVIENLLPSGLSQYFFFDGETMLADLSMKGIDSANNLRSAIYSIFDLDVYERALNHLGRIDLKTTVLGQLYLSKADESNNIEIKKLKEKIDQTQNALSQTDNQLTDCDKQRIELKEFIKQNSEKIGQAMTTDDYHIKRAHCKNQRDAYFNLIKDKQHLFGEEIETKFPLFLISSVLCDTVKFSNFKIQSPDFIPGLNMNIIDYIIEHKKCICNHEVSDQEIEILKSYKALLPPRSYKGTYDTLCENMRMIQSDYDECEFNSYVELILKFLDEARKCDQEIKELDLIYKDNQRVQKFIEDRSVAEVDLVKLEKKNDELKGKQLFLKSSIKKDMLKFDQLLELEQRSMEVERKLIIMESVKNHFEMKLDSEAKFYSQKLKGQIEILLKKMLTSCRNVDMSSDFCLRVYDNYNDESKSEGQFAVISFAYIGGILKLLNDYFHNKKEYPLILDGPFSKLDEDQKRNVIRTIPLYAPQVILFSKDDLNDYFNDDALGKVYTIISNDEKNVASIKEGYLWKFQQM